MKDTKENEENAAIIKTLETIAENTLWIETLETRNSDGLDFSDQSVWQLRKALLDAYKAGKNAAK